MQIIFETKFGSHVYGTNTPNSDLDYKGIFLAPIEDIIFGKKNDSIVTCSKVKKGLGVRNTKDDIDHEFKELRKFIYDALDGQTYAVDMLYTPHKFWKSDSLTWDFIVSNRDKFLSKKVNAFIGYCNQQASKYGLKGTRLGTVKMVIDTLKTFEPTSRLKENPKFASGDFIDYKTYTHKVGNETKDDEMLEILGKLYSGNTQVKLILASLEKFYNGYGERAVMAMNNDGIDFKAISHAYRCCYQLIELATKHRVDFPLAEAPYLTKIKLGEVSWPQKVQDELPALMEKAIKLVKESDLPEEPDREFWNKFIFDTYLKYVKSSNIKYEPN